MVIDLTRRPIFINTDICPSWVVVRTAANTEVDGRVRRTVDSRYTRGRGERHGGNKTLIVDIGAQRAREGRTVMEVRLPLDHVVRRRMDEPRPNPFEVATLYTDAFTKTVGTWRAQILVECTNNKNGSVWFVTVRDEVENRDIVTATAKDLDASRHSVLVVTNQKPPDELFPIDRLTPGAEAPGPLSVWERLRRIEYSPNPSLDDDDP